MSTLYSNCLWPTQSNSWVEPEQLEASLLLRWAELILQLFYLPTYLLTDNLVRILLNFWRTQFSFQFADALIQCLNSWFFANDIFPQGLQFLGQLWVLLLQLANLKWECYTLLRVARADRVLFPLHCHNYVMFVHNTHKRQFTYLSGSFLHLHTIEPHTSQYTHRWNGNSFVFSIIIWFHN